MRLGASAIRCIGKVVAEWRGNTLNPSASIRVFPSAFICGCEFRAGIGNTDERRWGQEMNAERVGALLGVDIMHRIPDALSV
jgi:hypothetical protein